MARGFLTGSRAYGSPKEDSDYDVVLLVTPDAFQAMIDCSDLKDKTVYGETVTLRFGKLNVIVTTSQKTYSIWQLGTEILKARGTVTRADAVKQFQSLMTAK